MGAPDVDRLLAAVAAGELSAEEASRQLARLPFADLGHARIDHHRSHRQGFPEAVYGPGKSTLEVEEIVEELLEHSEAPVIVTRATAEQAEAVVERAAAHGLTIELSGPEGCSTAVVRPTPDRGLRVVVITAGTADGPVADECAAVLRACGLGPSVLRDRGVAGIHRLADAIDQLAEADAVVVVAGMEGALASVVGGIARGPVVAVPTSVGYGAGLEGVTALLAMMASCAAGISVVGIDNGYGAAMAVVRALEGR